MVPICQNAYMVLLAEHHDLVMQQVFKPIIAHIEETSKNKMVVPGWLLPPVISI